MATRVLLVTASCGVVAGAALNAFARSGNVFMTGPAIQFTLATLIAGVLSAVILLAIGRHRQVARGLLSFSLAMTVTLSITPMIWPYPAPERPVPLGGKP